MITVIDEPRLGGGFCDWMAENMIDSSPCPFFSPPDVCSAINVTVVPSPVAMAAEGSNVTLTCRVGQRRRSGSLPVVRWMFVPEHGGEEILVARVNMRRAKFYGNYTKSFSAPKLRLTVVKQGHTYELLLLDAAPGDCGTYTCRAQEFRTHKGRWKASTNSSASTELKGTRTHTCTH